MADDKKKKSSSKDKGMDTLTKDGKLESLKLTLDQIEKQYGKGAIMKMGDHISKNISVIPSGCLSLDVAIGVGGVPKGRIIEIYGPESSGKTTLALHMVAQAQKAGGIAAFVDAEHALDPVYAKNLGVNIDELYISQPDDGEQALEITEAMVRSGAIDIVIVDSVAALVPKAEINGEMGDAHMGLQARLMSQALRKLTGIIGKFGCIVIFINQLRDKIGNMYGASETTTGGRALKFYASIRIDVRRVDYLKNGSEIIGNRTRAKIVKNKVAPPFKSVEFDIMYGKGISKIGDIIDLGSTIGVVTRSGAYYYYGELRLGQGRENAKQFLSENPDMCNEIENAVRKYYELPTIEQIKDMDNELEDNENDSERDKKKTRKKSSKSDDTEETLALSENSSDDNSNIIDENDETISLQFSDTNNNELNENE